MLVEALLPLVLLNRAVLKLVKMSKWLAILRKSRILKSLVLKHSRKACRIVIRERMLVYY